MDKIHELLTRGVDSIYPSREALETILRSGKKLTLYQGFDPTGIQMHIGHMVGLRKLAQFQKLGHKVIFLIGDGTGLAGDPSGKTRQRERFLNRQELRQNAVDYIQQARKIVDFTGENPIEIRYNGDWLTKLILEDVLTIAGHFSLQQLAERDLFQERIKKGESINLREFLYPLLQAYDSVAMKVDLEIGGNDQTFNMLCGRQLVKDYLHKEKFVMTTPLFTDSQGKKIGKTEGNVIGLNDTPENLFGKIMSLPDDVIVKGFEYLTDIPEKEVMNIRSLLDKKENPLIYKKQLAFTIVKQLHSINDAKNAQNAFENIIQKKQLPNTIPQVILSAQNTLISYLDLLVHTGLANSKSDAKRLIEQGGVEIDNEKITELHGEITINDNIIIKVGKRKFVEVLVKN
jgi:tyrosyl-tRNA synthetase